MGAANVGRDEVVGLRDDIESIHAYIESLNVGGQSQEQGRRGSSPPSRLPGARVVRVPDRLPRVGPDLEQLYRHLTLLLMAATDATARVQVDVGSSSSPLSSPFKAVLSGRPRSSERLMLFYAIMRRIFSLRHALEAELAERRRLELLLRASEREAAGSGSKGRTELLRKLEVASAAATQMRTENERLQSALDLAREQAATAVRSAKALELSTTTTTTTTTSSSSTTATSSSTTATSSSPPSSSSTGRVAPPTGFGESSELSVPTLVGLLNPTAVAIGPEDPSSGPTVLGLACGLTFMGLKAVNCVAQASKSVISRVQHLDRMWGGKGSASQLPWPFWESTRACFGLRVQTLDDGREHGREGEAGVAGNVFQEQRGLILLPRRAVVTLPSVPDSVSSSHASSTSPRATPHVVTLWDTDAAGDQRPVLLCDCMSASRSSFICVHMVFVIDMLSARNFGVFNTTNEWRHHILFAAAAVGKHLQAAGVLSLGRASPIAQLLLDRARADANSPGQQAVQSPGIFPGQGESLGSSSMATAQLALRATEGMSFCGEPSGFLTSQRASSLSRRQVSASTTSTSAEISPMDVQVDQKRKDMEKTLLGPLQSLVDVLNSHEMRIVMGALNGNIPRGSLPLATLTRFDESTVSFHAEHLARELMSLMKESTKEIGHANNLPLSATPTASSTRVAHWKIRRSKKTSKKTQRRNSGRKKSGKKSSMEGGAKKRFKTLKSSANKPVTTHTTTTASVASFSGSVSRPFKRRVYGGQHGHGNQDTPVLGRKPNGAKGSSSKGSKKRKRA